MIELGLLDEVAQPGDHIAYFWETDEDFRSAVRFLRIGIDRGDYCVIFGHEDANKKVLDELVCQEIDCDRLVAERKLAVLTAGPTGEATLARIADNFGEALLRGAGMIRLLGNIGWGRPGWPEDHDILSFEARVTQAVAQLPAVVICMYDVGSLRGDILLKGALETHPLTIRRNVLRHNPHYVSIEEFLADLEKSA